MYHDRSRHHQLPSSGEEETYKYTGAVNRVTAHGDEIDKRSDKKRWRSPVEQVKKIGGDIHRDLYLNRPNTMTKTTNYYTYDLILTQDHRQTPKFEWKKGVNFDFMPNQKLDFPKFYSYNTLESPIPNKEISKKQLKKMADIYPEKPSKQILKYYKPVERPKKKVQPLKKKFKTTTEATFYNLDQLKREIEEKYKNNFYRTKTTLKSFNTFRKPELSSEPFKIFGAKTTAFNNLLESNELVDSNEDTGSTRYRGMSGVKSTRAVKNKYNYKDSIYIKEIIATSGPIRLYKSTSVSPKFKLEPPTREIISDHIINHHFASKNINDTDDSVYFRSHLDGLFKQQINFTDINSIPDITNYSNETNTVQNTNVFNKDMNDSEVFSIEGQNSKTELAKEDKDIEDFTTNEKYNKVNIDNENSTNASSFEDNFRKMKLEEVTEKEEGVNPDYKLSVSYGDY
ncbi:uncharacterized protein [Battus philenor]|uniref:uncharacterized protein n=1 Tax=Battus philenor TaxID=42288 RepID=UPI0035D0B93A